jgi:hypothetical protein
MKQGTPITTPKETSNNMSEPILCETCLGSGKVCIKCQASMACCRCIETVGVDVMSGYEPVLCDGCKGEGTF